MKTLISLINKDQLKNSHLVGAIKEVLGVSKPTQKKTGEEKGGTVDLNFKHLSEEKIQKEILARRASFEEFRKKLQSEGRDISPLTPEEERDDAIKYLRELEARKKDKEQEDWTPFQRFPDISSVEIKLSPWDELFYKFGIRKRRNKAALSYVRYRNRSVNRFAYHQIKRMQKARLEKNDRLYWTIAEHLMKRSNVFFLMGLKHVFPNWHRDFPFWQVLHLYKKYKKIALSESTKLEYHRAYFPKGDKWRPLGVPAPVWRVYLHLLNQFLVFRLEPDIDAAQHGFRPKRGTMTAWMEVLENVEKYPNIFEYDYKQFFPSLELKKVEEILESKNLPRKLVDQIIKMNTEQPKLPGLCERLLDESEVEDKQNWVKWEQRPTEPVSLETNPDDVITLAEVLYNFEYFGEGNSQIATKLRKLLQKEELDTVFFTSEDFSLFDSPLMHQHNVWKESLTKKSTKRLYLRGCAQGANTSPILSTLTLDSVIPKEQRRESIPKKGKLPLELWIRYADDIIRFLLNIPEDFDPFEMTQEMKDAGIEYATHKSGWVKKDGVWLKPLKFLGLIYDGNEKTFRAETRSGKSKLIFDKYTLLEALRLRDDIEGLEKDMMKYDAKSNSLIQEMKDKLSELTELDFKRKYAEKFGAHPASWLKFSMSQWFGFFMSRLYTGSWNVSDDMVQDFRLKYKQGSWVDAYQQWVTKPINEYALRRIDHLKYELQMQESGNRSYTNTELRRISKEIKELENRTELSIVTKLVKMDLTVFNSTSIAVLSCLDALKETAKRPMANYRFKIKDSRMAYKQIPKSETESSSAWQSLHNLMIEQFPVASAVLGMGPYINKNSNLPTPKWDGSYYRDGDPHTLFDRYGRPYVVKYGEQGRSYAPSRLSNWDPVSKTWKEVRVRYSSPQSKSSVGTK